jgi:hypothetical protein
VCIAHPGYYALGTGTFLSICAGNNYGYVSGLSTGGRYHNYPFHPGSGFTLSLHSVVVHQSRGVTDGFTCPQ